jgi:15-cis-phytoene synthase
VAHRAHTDVEVAYAECERITREQAKNFSYGIALLPAQKRRVLSAVYAFARRIDDIGDGTMPAADKIEALERAREDLAALETGGAGPAGTADETGGAGPSPGGNGRADLVLVALADAARRLPIPLRAFGELIDGCEADVRGTRYATFDDLEHYCRCVAGSIGRLSLGVFGSKDMAAAEPLADALGVALQITNILRDIREDLGNGRVYLPARDIGQFGCTIEPGGPDGQGVLQGDVAGLIRFECQRARDWYASGMALMPLLDRRSAACTGAMAGIYRRLLEHICADPQEALSRRMSLPASEKALVAAGALTGLSTRAGGSGSRRTAGRSSLASPRGGRA